jgi:predicted acyl esterase
MAQSGTEPSEADDTAAIIDEFPHPVREVEHALIPLSDGTRLAVRYWLPEDAEQNPVPAILEYIPYSKRDMTPARDERMHIYFAGHGYAALRVDMRGSGESEGVLLDEYLKQEQDDALEVIAWIAAQSWCTGRVGMMGKSWGGFNSLQVAARRPPALKAIITVYSTVDRYNDDVHYKSGCLLTDNASWAFVMFGHAARPPDPLLVGDSWRDMWRKRLDVTRPWLIEWLKHQRRDAYWKHGSVCEDFSAINCPVYAIGGWADGYANAVPRLLKGLQVPRKGLIGPWGHQFPNQAWPGPRIGFLQEALRWWNHWLKDIDTGIMDEPMYRVWLQHSVEPKAFYAERPGEWVAEESWPSARVRTQDYALDRRGLSPSPGKATVMTLTGQEVVGFGNLVWGNNGSMDLAEEPEDQRDDDARSLCFDTAPLDQATSFLGAPVVVLDVSVDRPAAFLCVRLCDVAPDGASTLVTYGLMNLAHDPGHEKVTPIVPGERRRVEVRLNEAAHRFGAGRRIRLAVSTSFWPIIWPSPEPVTLTLHTAESRLQLPIRGPRPADAQLRPFQRPMMSRPHSSTFLRPAAAQEMSVQRDVGSGRITVRKTDESGRVRFDSHGWEHGARSVAELSIAPSDPLSARLELKGQLGYARSGKLEVRIETYCALTADRESFTVHARLDVYEDDRAIHATSWLEKIPRDGL